MPFMHTPWSPHDRSPAQALALLEDDHDLALGWECALPALQVDAWEPLPATDREQGPSAAA